MQIYIATEEGGKLGPLFLHQVETLLREGRLQPSQLGWHRELAGWLPLKEIPAIRELLETKEREELKARLDRESADGTIITRNQVEEAAKGKTVLTSERRPLARFSARVFDAMLLSSVALFFVKMPVPPPEITNAEFYQWLAQPENVKQVLLFKIIICVAGVLLEALFITLWGTTPGKALFRIRLAGPDGQRLPFGRSLARASLVWFAGCGTWDACFSPLTLPFGLASLLQTGRTWWDARLVVAVHHSPLRAGHVLLILFAFYAILLSFVR